MTVAPVLDVSILANHSRGTLLRNKIITLLLLVVASAAQANTYVISTIADSGAGSLRQAILSSNSPAGGVHTLVFSTGFPDNGVILLDSDLPQILSQRLVVLGNDKLPHIDGQSSHSIFKVSTTTNLFELYDLSLQNALSTDKGACVSSGNFTTLGTLQAERVTFSNCKVSGPSLVYGGAIYWGRSEGAISLTDSRFIGNSVEATAANGQSSGGAVYVFGNVFTTRVLFEGNAALSISGGSTGGAISANGTGRLNTIFDTAFRLNTASAGSAILGYGGGIYIGCSDCTTLMRRSYLRGNSANYGGAIYARKPDNGAPDVVLELTNSSFYNNSVVSQGGAVFIGGGAGISAANNTFYNSDASAGAHLAFEINRIAQVLFFRANLFAPTYLGTACTGSPTITSPSLVGFNLFSDSSCASIATSALPSSPLGSVFVDERAGQIGVLRFSGAAVIDSISDSSKCEPLDARNQVRPIDGNGDGSAECDVGAFEDPRDIIFIDGFDG